MPSPTQSPYAMNPFDPTPKKKATPPAPFGATTNPDPGFGFGTTPPALMSPPTAAPSTGVAAPAPDPFTAMIMQFLQQSHGAAPAAGPDLGGLFTKLHAPRETAGTSLTDAYNVGSQLPSAAGSAFNPFNNPAMNSKLKKPTASPALSAATAGMSNPFAIATQ